MKAEIRVTTIGGWSWRRAAGAANSMEIYGITQSLSTLSLSLYIYIYTIRCNTSCIMCIYIYIYTTSYKGHTTCRFWAYDAPSVQKSSRLSACARFMFHPSGLYRKPQPGTVQVTLVLHDAGVVRIYGELCSRSEL